MKCFPTLALALMLATLASCDKTTKTDAPATTADSTTTTTQTSNEAVTPLTYAGFTQEVATVSNGKITYTNTQPVVIDFYATWCPPCKQLKPILETVATAYAGKVKVYKVDVDQERELAALYDIQSIPTLLYVTADGKAETVQGFDGGDEVRQRFEALLATPAK